MTAFRFRLQSLLDLRRTERDQRREELAQALRAEQILQDRHREAVEQEQAVRRRAGDSAQPGEIQVEALIDAARYGLILAAQRHAVAGQLAQLAPEIEARRERLMEADRQVKVLERLRDRRLDEHRQAELRREIQQLDEAASRRRDQEARSWQAWPE